MSRETDFFVLADRNIDKAWGDGHLSAAMKTAIATAPVLALVFVASAVFAAPPRGDEIRPEAASGWSIEDAELVRARLGEPLGHKHLVDEHRAMARESFGGADRSTTPRPSHLLNTVNGPRVSREVMGYLPYWSYTEATPYVPLRWDLLTILAWFSVEMDGTGAITNRRGWGGQTTARIVQDAHAHGVKVIITITNFTGSQIASIVNNATNRERAIDNCLMLMGEHGADGINIDFEFVPASARNGFVTFMTELKDAVRAAAPNGHEGHVSLAGPAVDWSSAYDYDVLLENTDGIMVMAYGYHWSGSNPGPNAPLRTGDIWSGRSIAWTVDDYLTYGDTENRGNVLIGLPWYGRDWQVTSTVVPGVKAGDGGSRTFKVAEPEALALGKTWEDTSKSVYYHREGTGQNAGKTYQVWYDDGRAFEAKVAYVDEMDLGGIGIWALGYEGNLPDFWNAIETVIGIDDPGPEPQPEVSPEMAEAEPLPEPGPEVVEAAEVVETPDVAEPVADITETDSGAPTGPAARVLSPSRGVASRIVQSEGCGGGGSSALAAIVLMSWLGLHARRRLA